ncbi:ABC-three component system middle component 6 [Methanoplanus limicola]|uniref:Uncharacterized protein n=1 Tax=Methanoplanus limicola DSM 2279 TaxID=937775 RepID=H1Z4H1_9EURY|nr:ABC-three component system middle component 6 [Methanoplanus limicola]EHQ36719.1 hypothetical protein Metlim_2681 [Methanoplanus limicola DSM 2279]
MILPNKYIKEDEALIGVGAILLKYLSCEKNLSELWDSVRNSSQIGSFERFILSLDLLYSLGLIEFKNNKLVRVKL